MSPSCSGRHSGSGVGKVAGKRRHLERARDARRRRARPSSARRGGARRAAAPARRRRLRRRRAAAARARRSPARRAQRVVDDGEPQLRAKRRIGGEPVAGAASAGVRRSASATFAGAAADRRHQTRATRRRPPRTMGRNRLRACAHRGTRRRWSSRARAAPPARALRGSAPATTARSAPQRESLRDAAGDANPGERPGPAPNAMPSSCAARARFGEHRAHHRQQALRVRLADVLFAHVPARAVADGDAAPLGRACRARGSSCDRFYSTRRRTDRGFALANQPTRCPDIRRSCRTAARRPPADVALARPGRPRRRAHRRQGRLRRGRAAGRTRRRSRR